MKSLTRHINHRHIFLLGLIIIVAGFIAASDTLHSKSEELISASEAVISKYPGLGIVLFVLLAMISAMLAFFSSAILVPVGVYTWGNGVCFLLLWLGWLLGGVAAFGIGRYLGRPVAAKMIGEARMADFEQQLSHHARFVHILLFQAAVPSEVPGYVLGTLRYRFWLFLLALAIVELPYAFGTVYLGAKFLERDITLFILIGMGGVLVGAFAYILYRRQGND